MREPKGKNDSVQANQSTQQCQWASGQEHRSRRKCNFKRTRSQLHETQTVLQPTDHRGREHESICNLWAINKSAPGDTEAETGIIVTQAACHHCPHQLSVWAENWKAHSLTRRAPCKHWTTIQHWKGLEAPGLNPYSQPGLLESSSDAEAGVKLYRLSWEFSAFLLEAFSIRSTSQSQILPTSSQAHSPLAQNGDLNTLGPEWPWYPRKGHQSATEVHCAVICPFLCRNSPIPEHWVWGTEK